MKYKVRQDFPLSQTVSMFTSCRENKLCQLLLTRQILDSLSQELKETTSENMHRSESIDVGKMSRSQETEMSVSSLEREIEVMGITAREKVLGDPDMLDIIFSYLDPQSVKTVRLVST